MKVICISAKARCGKDVSGAMLAEIFESYGKKVLITHYADLVKYICRTFFDWDGDKNEYGRSLLQRVGTDTIGKQYPDFWVDFLVKLFKVFENEWDIVLIPDCRYPIEYEGMKANFDTDLIRIERPGFISNLTEEQKKHPSEVSLDNYTFDKIIINDGTLQDLKNKLLVYAKEVLN